MTVPVSLSLVIAGSIIVCVAFCLRSLSGFGGALLSIPLLSLLFPVKFIVPVECIFEVVLSLILLPQVYRFVDRDELLRLLGGALVGSVMGAHVLVTLANRPLKMTLGVVVILAALLVIKDVSLRRLPAWAGVLTGLAGGILGGMFGTSGPAYVAYLALRIEDKRAFRATLIALFSVEYSWRLIVFSAQGLLGPEGLLLGAVLMPALVIGTIGGSRLHRVLPDVSFRGIVAGLLVVSGGLCFI